MYINTIIGSLIYYIYRLWCQSLHYKEINRKYIENHTHNNRSVVLCLWHDELFSLIYLKKDLNIIAIVSESKDGEILANVLQRMKLETARGSTTRGGVKALLHAAHRMKESNICSCITVDGPRGPRHKVKEGAIFLAKQAHAPIVPIRLFLGNAYHFSSWDHFQLPLPFSRVTMVCDEAYYVESDIKNSENMTQECQKLENHLNNLHPPDKRS